MVLCLIDWMVVENVIIRHLPSIPTYGNADGCKTPTLYGNNKSAISLLANQDFHEKIKHFKVDYHFVREKYGDITIFSLHVSSE